MAQTVNERAIVLYPDQDGDVVCFTNDTGATIEHGHILEVNRLKGYVAGSTTESVDVVNGAIGNLHLAGVEAVFTAPLNTAHTNTYKIGEQVAIASGVVVPLGTAASIPLRGFVTVPKDDPVNTLGSLTSNSGAAASGDSFIRLGMVPNFENGWVDDPGDAGLINAAHNSIVEIVTAGAETRTLKDPLFSGTILTLTMKTDGGNCVVTAETAINQLGNNTLTFADANDQITLVSIPNGASAYKWSIIATDGVALSTV